MPQLFSYVMSKMLWQMLLSSHLLVSGGLVVKMMVVVPCIWMTQNCANLSS